MRHLRTQRGGILFIYFGYEREIAPSVGGRHVVRVRLSTGAVYFGGWLLRDDPLVE